MPQFLRPVADISDSGDLETFPTDDGVIWDKLDESPADISDGVRTPANPSGSKFRVQMDGGTDPESDGNHSPKLMCRKGSSGGQRIDLTGRVFLPGGVTPISTHIFTNISESWTEYGWNLTAAEIDLIPAADYATGLEVEWEFNAV